MDFEPAGELIRRAAAEGYAVPCFCVWNSETMDTVLRVAADCRAPVVLMAGPGEFGLLPPEAMAATARAIAARYAVPAALHLDHGDTPECVAAYIPAGFTTVMLDYSDRPFAENADALRRVVEEARPRGITVEGEIGAVGRIDDITGEGTRPSSLTDPDEARTYVERTGVDVVAISIGNAHGTYPSLPVLVFDLLAELRDATGMPLALHGGSGTPEEDLKRAISLGIAKVNIASELVRAVRETLLTRWTAHDNLWTPIALADAMAAMAPVVEKWLRRSGAAGKA